LEVIRSAFSEMQRLDRFQGRIGIIRV